MKYVALGFILIVIALGASIALTAAIKHSEEREIQEYIDSRGAAPVPRSWQGKIGEGI